MTSDPKILSLQKDLLRLGLNPGPLDGIMGSSTRGACHSAAQRYGLVDFTGGEVPSTLIAEIHNLAEKKRKTVIPLPPNFVDVSEDSAPGWREGYRPLSEVEGVTLHQTGCPLASVSQAEIAYYAKTGELTQKDTPALRRWCKHLVSEQGEPARYAALKTHFGITYEGVIIQVHPLEQWGWSAQGFSKKTFSIEIAGFFEGIDGDPKTRPGGPPSFKTQRATEAQIPACKALIRYLKLYMANQGAKFDRIYAHRFATNDRTPDPGERVWKEIALPMMAELGMNDGGPGYVRGKGQPCPEAWDPSRKGIPYELFFDGVDYGQ